MRVLIVEDEDLAAKRLIQLLQDIGQEFEITGPVDSVSKAVEVLQSPQKFDLLFLDIQLADGKSFSIFDKVKVNIPVIFTTAYDEYAIQAFELNSIDYLLKPINREKLKTSIDKFNMIRQYYADGNLSGNFSEILHVLQQNRLVKYKTRFLINKGDALVPVTTGEIAYFTAEDKAVMLCTSDSKKSIISHTLDELERKLDPRQFFRVNRQYIVNISAIKKVHNYFNYKLKIDLTTNTDDEIIVSKAKTTEFKEWMSGEKE